MPTVVGAAGGNAETAGPAGKPLDGVNQWPMLTTDGGSSARLDVLINIEREVPTTAPPAKGTHTHTHTRTHTRTYIYIYTVVYTSEVV